MTTTTTRIAQHDVAEILVCQKTLPDGSGHYVEICLLDSNGEELANVIAWQRVGFRSPIGYRYQPLTRE